MSVYKPKGSPYFHYDFVRKGRRFHGSTGVEAKRAAQAVEASFKVKAALGQLDAGADMTLDVAALRWWTEHGQDLKSAKDVDRLLDAAVKLVGKGKMLSEITTAVLATAIQKRRGQITRRKRPPANATVNHAVVRVLRPILRTAARKWGVVGLPVVDWGELMMAEPKPKARDFTADELAAFKARLAPWWHDFIDVMAGYGPRLGEMFFEPDDVNVERGSVRLRDRKNGEDHTIPLLPADCAMLAARVSRAKAAKLKTVWYREVGGKPLPLSYNQAQWALHKALDGAGLKASKGARIHDLRHHAGTAMLRHTGNLRLAQRLLGHASIVSTMRYAHASEDDLRAALEIVEQSRHSTETTSTEEAETLINKGVAGNE